MTWTTTSFLITSRATQLTAQPRLTPTLYSKNKNQVLDLQAPKAVQLWQSPFLIWGPVISERLEKLSQGGLLLSPLWRAHRKEALKYLCKGPMQPPTNVQQCKLMVLLSSWLETLGEVDNKHCYFNYMKWFCFNYSNKRFFHFKLIEAQSGQAKSSPLSPSWSTKQNPTKT